MNNAYMVSEKGNVTVINDKGNLIESKNKNCNIREVLMLENKNEIVDNILNNTYKNLKNLKEYKILNNKKILYSTISALLVGFVLFIIYNAANGSLINNFINFNSVLCFLSGIGYGAFSVIPLIKQNILIKKNINKDEIKISSLKVLKENYEIQMNEAKQEQKDIYHKDPINTTIFLVDSTLKAEREIVDFVDNNELIKKDTKVKTLVKRK